MRQDKGGREDFWMHCGEMNEEIKDYLFNADNVVNAEISMGDEWFSLFCC